MAFLGFKEILELIDKVAASGVSGVEVESAGVRVKVDGASRQVVTVTEASAPPSSASTSVPGTPGPASSPAAPAAAKIDEDAVDETWHIVTSPIVGTFYRAPNPEADVFVNVGDRVNKGKVLCIIEAMKLMNEIESDAEGVIAKIFPQNGQPIEYGEKLFALKR